MHQSQLIGVIVVILAFTATFTAAIRKAETEDDDLEPSLRGYNIPGLVQLLNSKRISLGEAPREHPKQRDFELEAEFESESVGEAKVVASERSLEQAKRNYQLKLRELEEKLNQAREASRRLAQAELAAEARKI